MGYKYRTYVSMCVSTCYFTSPCLSARSMALSASRILSTIAVYTMFNVVYALIRALVKKGFFERPPVPRERYTLAVQVSVNEGESLEMRVGRVLLNRQRVVFFMTPCNFQYALSHNSVEDNKTLA